jgi:hypothetical protein
MTKTVGDLALRIQSLGRKCQKLKHRGLELQVLDLFRSSDFGFGAPNIDDTLS